jgi:serine/threonine protein kinase
MVVGTPHYMSPEQALGRQVDARTDIFSLGVVLYEMLSGKKPFLGESVTEILLQIVMNEPRDISAAASGVTPALANIVRRCMAKQPDDRFPSADALRGELADCLREVPGRARQSQVPTISMRKSPSASHPAVKAPTPPRSPSVRPAGPPPVLKDDLGAAPANIRDAAPSISGASRRALVADDDPATRYILASVLQRHQFAFDEAENGADAVKYLKKNEYALVFLDLLMPRIDGWGVIDYLRSHHRGTRPRHLFLVTGVQDQKLSTADQDVVTGIVYKPIDIDQVERVMKGI